MFLNTHDIIVLTVPRMYVLQTGQLRSLGEQWSQETRCPQGRKTVFMSLSMQTLHVFASWSRRFSSISSCSSSSGIKQRQQQRHHHHHHHQQYHHYYYRLTARYTVVQPHPFHLTVVLQMSTDFYHIWHTTYWVNLQHKLFIYLPYSRTAVTLPWETSVVIMGKTVREHTLHVRRSSSFSVKLRN